MSCCETKLEARRNADARWTITPSSRKYSFSGFTPLFTVRDGDTVLMQINETPTVNGSSFVVVEDSVSLTLKKADTEILAGLSPDTETKILSYDVTLTDQTGFENWIMGGAFVVAGINDASCDGCNDALQVDLGGVCIEVVIEGGNTGIGASINLAELQQAVQDAEEAAEQSGQAAAEADADRAAAELAAAQAQASVTLTTLTRAQAIATNIPPIFNAVRTTGYSAVGDGGDALYRKVSSEPPHPGKFQSSDGAWWELAADFAALEMFGGRADNGTTDNYQPWRDAIYWAYLKGRQVVLTRTGTYRFKRRPAQSPAPIEYPADIAFANPFVKMLVENGNDAEGVFILSSDVTIRGGTISVLADSAITNGTGHCGTCITIQRWFVDPRLPEPPLYKNIVIRDMTLLRETGSATAHAISIMSRVSHVSIENCDFIGAGATNATGCHGNAVLTHWGAWTNGVSTTQLSYDAQTGNFTPGETLTGGTSGATGYIVDVDDSGATGTVFLKNVVGTFVDNEAITDPLGGAALANGGPSQGLRQSPFPPGHYSFHPNNVRVRNVRLRNTGRLIACSSSYSVDVDGVDIKGPVQGNQLVDLPVGDEADTFAHPDDRGRVYDGFSFRNIRGAGLTGTGANAVTAIDCSGYSTSKQTDAALAAYAGPEYAGEPFNAVQGRYRQPEWKNALFENFTFDYGPADPPSSTVVQRMIWIRNVRGQMTFKNFNMEARENAIRSGVPDPVILGLTMANNIGSFVFDTVKSLGAAVIDSTDTASFIDCDFNNRVIDGSTATFLLTGSQPTVTINANAAKDATVLSVPAVSGTSIVIGDRLVYAGGVVYCTEFVPNGAGVTQIKVTPLPAAATSGTVFTIDHRNRNITFDNCNVRRGARGFDVSNSVGTRINGGEIADSGQYGVLVNTGGDVAMSGTLLNNGGQRRATIPADASLATRDVAVNAGSFIGRGLRFEDSAYVVVNYVVGAGVTSASLQDSVFSGVPINGKIQLAALSNGKPVMFSRNVDGAGAAVFASGTWTPVVRINDSPTGVVIASTGEATYTVNEDRVMLNFDVTLSSKGAGTGSLSVSGLPFPQTGSQLGTASLLNATGLTGGQTMRATGSVLRIDQAGANGFSSVQASNLTDTSRIIGSIVYRRSA